MAEKINKWFIAYKPNKGDLFDINGFTVVEPPTNHYQADPFIIKQGKTNYVFHELYDYEKGVIAYSKLTKQGLSKPKKVIELDTHISFPALYTEEDDVYMTFENVLGGELVIYKAISFPDKWEKVKVVAVGRYDDPILFRKDNQYYIHTVEGDNNIRVFTSNNLMGEWSLVRADSIPNSRPAGNIFAYNGRQIKPVQRSELVYGGGVIFKDLESGNEVGQIGLDWYPDLTGSHTFNFNDDYIVIDGRIKL